MSDFDKAALDALAVGEGNEFITRHVGVVFLDALEKQRTGELSLIKIPRSRPEVKDKFCCSIGAAITEDKQEQGSD